MDARRPGYLVFLLFVPLVALACGGGGDDVVDDTEPVILAQYRFSVIGQQGGLSVSLDEGVLGLDPDPGRGPGLTGTYTVATGGIVLATGSFFEILDGAEVLLGDVDVEIVEDLTIPVDGPPTSGALLMTWGETLVRADVTSAPPGVNISVDGGAATYYDWDALEDALDAGAMAPTEVAVAGLASGGVRVMIELMGMVVESFDLIDDDLIYYNPFTVYGDGFAPTHVAPPGVEDPGFFTLGWDDAPGAGFDEVGPGDSFEWNFWDYWEDDPFEDYDDFYVGRILLENFTEVLDANDRLVRIGFEPSAQPGGVTFDDFTRGEVDLFGTMPQVHLDTTFNGRLTIVFYE